MTVDLPRYDVSKSYAWNYDHAPDPVDVDVPDVGGDYQFCGLPVPSPIGVPAGPLLNGKWCLYYASLGFDVLTYKTVRSGKRACYPLPNLQPVACEELSGGEADLVTTTEMAGTWAVSYGMPSRSPDEWRADVEMTRAKLARDKLLVVSVVGTIQKGWSIGDLGDDYAQCAHWAKEAGADVVEANLSCPNVSSCDGQLYQNPEDAAQVAARIRAQTEGVPLVIKIGHVRNESDAEALVDALAPHVDALAMTNSIASTVRAEDGSLLFEGQCRGICGSAIRHASIRQVSMFHQILQRRRSKMQVIGVGGVANANHVQQYLAAGAHAVHIASAAMVNPRVALEIRQDLARVTH